MNAIKLFRVADGQVKILRSKPAETEKNLHWLLEKYMETFFGVTMLAREYPTGRTHKGQIDTLGIDEDGCPVIAEYKRKYNEN